MTGPRSGQRSISSSALSARESLRSATKEGASSAYFSLASSDLHPFS